MESAGLYQCPSEQVSHQRCNLYSNLRQQHTLDSIGHEESRSRNPIVVGEIRMTTNSNMVTISSNNDERDLKQQETSTNPFIMFNSRLQNTNNTTNGNNVPVSYLNVAEQISLQSFERRRSVYERETAALANNQQNVVVTAHNGSREVGDDNYDDDLSVDNILSQIESGKLSETTTLNISSNMLSNYQTRGVGSLSDCASDLQQLNRRRLSQMTSCSTLDLSTRGGESSSSSNLSQSPNERLNKENHLREASHGFEIVWLNFTYSVEPAFYEDPRWGRINSMFHKESRMILKGLSGGLKSGQMIALMGPSGAGKTCLLECIAGLRQTGIGGSMFLRGRRQAELSIVPQTDDFMPQFTVEEIINYGSRMKNPPKTDHTAVTNHVINQLGLNLCRGNNIQRCSGGQRKRVAIAQELVSRPNILILDEPTSGLDSSCCYQTMKVLRDVLGQSMLTEEPMAIVTTIHQPSAKVFKMFDLVYLLGKTGKVAYSGPPNELLDTINRVTGLECPQYSNPADYMIELVSYDYGEEPVEKLVANENEKARRFEIDYENRLGHINNSTTIFDSPPPPPPPSLDILEDKIADDRAVQYKQNISIPLRKATSSADRKHPFFWHTFVHIHRSFLQSIRDPIVNNMRILIHLGYASLLVLLYGKKSGEARGCPPVLGLPSEITDPHTESMVDLSDNVGYLFMCIMLITYVSLMSTVLTFPVDIKTVGKEYKNGWYGTFTYFLGKSIADLPFIILYPIAYCLITWYSTHQGHQDHNWRFFSFTGLIILNAMNSQSFGLILGAVFVNSVTAATFLGPVITIPWYLFTGFTKRVHRLAEPYKTTSNFLFTRYVFEGILDTVYGHERCNCSQFLQQYYELRYEETLRIGQLISVETLSSLDYYDGLETVTADVRNKSALYTRTDGTDGSGGGQWLANTVDAASTVFSEDLNLAGLVENNVKANSLFSFGLDFEPTCPTGYKTFVLQDFRLGERTIHSAFVTLLCMMAVIRLLTFLVVTWKIRTRHL